MPMLMPNEFPDEALFSISTINPWFFYVPILWYQENYLKTWRPERGTI